MLTEEVWQLNDELLNDFLLEAFPNPERKGCPTDETLKAFAEDRLPLGSPVLSHVSSCSPCYREYRNYRLDWKEQSIDAAAAKKPIESSKPIPINGLSQRRPQFQKFAKLAVAAGFAVAIGSGLYLVREHQAPPSTSFPLAGNSTPVNVNLDLLDAVTSRGIGDEPMPLEQVSLPSAIVNLTVTLPRFSQIGPYQLLITKDRVGRDVVARGVGQAVQVDKKESLTVSLDLRQTSPGMYFLATMRGSDNGTYYYPLKIK